MKILNYIDFLRALKETYRYARSAETFKDEACICILLNAKGGDDDLPWEERELRARFMEITGESITSNTFKEYRKKLGKRIDKLQARHDGDFEIYLIETFDDPYSEHDGYCCTYNEGRFQFFKKEIRRQIRKNEQRGMVLIA